MLAVEVVEEAGFAALQATDADSAVSLLESRSDICLVFTDINMPGTMDGLKLAHAVHDRWPSGEDSRRIWTNAAAAGGFAVECPLRRKPYRAEAMVDELRSLVGSLAPTVADIGLLKRGYEPFCSDLWLKLLSNAV